MRLIFTLSLVLAILSFSWAQVTIEVEVFNADDDNVRISYLESTNDRHAHVLKLDGNNKGKIRIPLKEAMLIKLSYEIDDFEFFVQKDDHLILSFESMDPRGTMKLSSKQTADNECLKVYRELFPIDKKQEKFSDGFLSFKIDKKIYDAALSEGSNNYIRKIMERERRQSEFIKNYQLANKLSPEFSIYMSETIYYESRFNQRIYFLVNHLMTKEEVKAKMIEFNMNTRWQEDKPKHKNNPIYLDYLSAQFQLKARVQGIEQRLLALSLHEIIKLEVKDSYLKYTLLARQLLQAQKERNIKLAQKQFPDFKRTCPYPDYIKKIEAAYGMDLYDSAQQSAPDFRFPDQYGREMSLSSFRGRVVYISFWASWCKPCISSYQKTEELRLRLQSKGVVLLNISIDDSEDAWRAAMGKVRIPGVNLLAKKKENTDFIHDYELYALPVYYIINKKGQFTYLSDNPDRDLVQEFEALVRE